tara:strand:+ start:1691 stop:1936 length:246 start_codon:yes stop_codon:yes gene_type:complete
MHKPNDSRTVFETVKYHVKEHSRKNSHMSFHRDDEHSAAVEALGESAVGPLFRLMIELPFESVHFGFNIIPRIIDMPENIN